MRDAKISNGGRQVTVETLFNKMLNHAIIDRKNRKMPKLASPVTKGKN